MARKRYGRKKRSFKRKATSSRRRPAKRAKTFARRVIGVINRKAEVKEISQEIAKNYELRHNIVQNLTTNAFYSDVGTRGH